MLKFVKGILTLLIVAGLTLVTAGSASADVLNDRYDFPVNLLVYVPGENGNGFDHIVCRFTDGDGKNSLLFVCHGSVDNKQQYRAHMGGKSATNYAWFVDNELLYHINRREIAYNFEKVYMLSCYSGYAPTQTVSMPNIKNPTDNRPMELKMVLYSKNPEWFSLYFDNYGYARHIYLKEQIATSRAPRRMTKVADNLYSSSPVIGRLFKADEIIENGSTSETDGTDSAICYDRGNSFLQSGEYDQAIAEFNKAININDSYVNAYAGRGYAYRQLNKFDDALNDYDKAISLNPDDETLANLFSDRGITNYQMKKYDSAVADYSKAIELYDSVVEPDRDNIADAYCNRGIAYRNLVQYGNAINDYKKAIELNNGDAGVYNNLGFAYRVLGDYEAAIENYNKALDINPEYILALRNRGKAYNETRDYDNALKDFSRAIELDKDNPTDYYNRGIAYSGLKNYKSAIDDYTTAIKADKNYRDAYIARGRAYNALGDKTKAEADFKMADSLSSEY